MKRRLAALGLDSHLTLLVAAVVILEVVAFILFLLAFCAGVSSGSTLRELAILTVDTSSLANTTHFSPSSSSSSIVVKDWYEAHYLSICSGMWNWHTASAGVNHSDGGIMTCTAQSAGYTFSLSQAILGRGGAVNGTSSLLDQQHTLETESSFVLLTLGFTSIGISVTEFLFNIPFLYRYGKELKETGGRYGLHGARAVMLRIGFLATIASPILMTISTAQVTTRAERMVAGVGVVELGVGGERVHAWMDAGFYIVMWFGVACLWIALGTVVWAAFLLARLMQGQQNNKAKKTVVVSTASAGRCR